MIAYLIPLSLLFQTALSQTTTSARILGIGIGTLIIIIAVIFSIIWCLACRNSSKPELYSLLGLLVPGILILAFAVTPKTNQVTTTSTITDGNFIPHIVFMVLSLLGFLITGGYLLISNAFTYRKAKNVARAAFVMR
jgi:cadmium resistance protein CadD (predicted permease)